MNSIAKMILAFLVVCFVLMYGFADASSQSKYPSTGKCESGKGSGTSVQLPDISAIISVILNLQVAVGKLFGSCQSLVSGLQVQLNAAVAVATQVQGLASVLTSVLSSCGVSA